MSANLSRVEAEKFARFMVVFTIDTKSARQHHAAIPAPRKKQVIHSKVLASALIAIGTLAAVMPAAAQRGDGYESRDRRRDGGQDRDRESRGGYEQRGDVDAQGGAQAYDPAANGSVSDRPRYEPRAQESVGQPVPQSGDWRQRDGQRYDGNRDGQRHDGGGHRDGGNRYDGNRDGYGGRHDGNRYDGRRDGNWDRDGRRDWDRHDGRRGDGRWDGHRDGRRDYGDRRHWDRNDWHNDWNRRGWTSRYDYRNYRRDWHNGYAWRRYNHGSRYVRPYGFRDFRWSIGVRMPSVYYVPDYYIDWRAYDLAPPPYGYHWVRVERDVYLVDIRTGVILDVVYDLFY